MSKRLRAAGQAAATRLEATDFHDALREGQLPLIAGVAWLRTWATLRRVLERSASELEHEVNRALWDDALAETPALQEQLGSYEEVPPLLEGTLAPVVSLVDLIRGWAQADDPAWAGAIHALRTGPYHGLRLSGTIAPQDKRGWGSMRLDATAPRTPDFEQRLDALRGEEDEDLVVAAAERTYRELEAIVGSIHPKPYMQIRASDLNGEAGRHQITTDPREVVAAIDGGRRTWNTFPYYQARYADRGERFTRSDSAWLASLAGSPDADRQVEWLAGVLAARGMPTYLLEVNLEHLAEALSEANPAKASVYLSLHKVAGELRAKREAVMASKTFDSIARGFGRKTPIANLGPVLVSAVVDEVNGYAKAVTSLTDFLCDAERFDDRWIQAVKRTIQKARRATR